MIEKSPEEYRMEDEERIRKIHLQLDWFGVLETVLESTEEGPSSEVLGWKYEPTPETATYLMLYRSDGRVAKVTIEELPTVNPTQYDNCLQCKLPILPGQESIPENGGDLGFHWWCYDNSLEDVPGQNW